MSPSPHHRAGARLSRALSFLITLLAILSPDPPERALAGSRERALPQPTCEAAVVTYRGTPGVANIGLWISPHPIGPNGATTYTSGSTSASWREGGGSTTQWT